MRGTSVCGVDDVEPLIAIVSDAATGEQVAAILPLICRLQKRSDCRYSQDLGTTDYMRRW